MDKEEKTISFSEKDDDGNIRETYGRFEKDEQGRTFNEKIKDLVDKINKGNNAEKKTTKPDEKER